MTDHHGRFIWYELITTNTTDAKAFYAEVVGWGAEDASTPELAYTFFSAGKVPVGGLMELPEEARRMGATPRWMGYVGVRDIDAAADRIVRLGGVLYVPPTNSNIGRIAVMTDPQKATFALVQGLKSGQRKPVELDSQGGVGWHELIATDGEKAFAFYSELFGWQKAEAEPGPLGTTYQPFSVGGRTIGGIFPKGPDEPVPFWLYYVNVGDVDTAAERVKKAGGRITDGPLELPGGKWIVRCTDPQGAGFALQGKRSPDGIGWSAEWQGISSKGRVVTKPRS